MRLKGKTIIVTGSGQGIGKGIALKLAKEGSSVVVADLNEENAQKVADEINSNGGKALAVKVDITSAEMVKNMILKTIDEFGEISGLVNNAGWDKVEPFMESTEDTWDRVIAINIKGTISCCKAVLQEMIPNNYGKIINIASDAGRVGSSGEAVYSATKGGVIAFTKTLAREMARYKINVNCIAPGPTDTPLFEEISSYNPKIAEGLKKAIPFRRLGKPEDLANAVAFMISDEAEYITGQTLSVSGGLTMV